MSKMNRILQLCILGFTLAAVPCSQSQIASKDHKITLVPGKDSIVHLFYQPADGHYFHAPLLFRVVQEDDPRWNTAPIFDVGRTAYISLSEMNSLIAALSGADLSWNESSAIEGLETYRNLRSQPDMSIKIVSAGGTAKAMIDPDRICRTLAPLDAALKTPRALWEFRFFRVQYRCYVQGFDPNAYSDRLP